jgi:hypothetical protein
MLGATLTKDEVDEFMREADVVGIKNFISRNLISCFNFRMGMENWIMMSLLR